MCVRLFFFTLFLQQYSEEIASALDLESRKVEAAVNEIIGVFKDRSGIKTSGKPIGHVDSQGTYMYMYSTRTTRAVTRFVVQRFKPRAFDYILCLLVS